MMYLVKVSKVPPLTSEQVEAFLLDEPDTNVLAREQAEHVLRSASCLTPLLAEYMFRTWSHKADVRAGRARVRIVEIPERGAQ